EVGKAPDLLVRRGHDAEYVLGGDDDGGERARAVAEGAVDLLDLELRRDRALEDGMRGLWHDSPVREAQSPVPPAEQQVQTVRELATPAAHQHRRLRQMDDLGDGFRVFWHPSDPHVRGVDRAVE